MRREFRRSILRAWAKDPVYLPYPPGGGLYLRPSDLSKLGMLALGNGVFEGRRLIQVRSVMRRLGEEISVISAIWSLHGDDVERRLGLASPK